MALRILQLGTPRIPGEGLRIGTVRRPPRGVPRSEFATQDWYDIWYPNLAPSAEVMKLGQAANTAPDATTGDKAWAAFAKRYRAEMGEPDAARTLDLLAALSKHSHFSVGCYCENEARCHRSLLRALLQERGAEIASA